MTTDHSSQAQTGNDIYERVTNQIIAAIEAGAGSTGCSGITTDRPSPRPSTSPLARPIAASTSSSFRCGAGVQLAPPASGALIANGRSSARRSARASAATSSCSGRRRIAAATQTVRMATTIITSPHGACLLAAISSSMPLRSTAATHRPSCRCFPRSSGSNTRSASCAALGIDIRHGGSQACYIPSKDCVQMPDFARFDAIAYYAGVAPRMPATLPAPNIASTAICPDGFGSAPYAMEECTVELPSAAPPICAALNPQC